MKTEEMVILREVCRALCTTDLGINDIARMHKTSAKRVFRIKNRLETLRLSWDQVQALSQKKLQGALYPKRKNRYVRRKPNWVEVYELMRNKHQTLIQIWEEYRLVNPADAYSYSQFTRQYKGFLSTVDVSMKMIHRPGECVYVDYAGLTIEYTENKVTKKAHVFVGVSGASNYTFAMACRDQSTESWIDAHNKMFAFFGGVHQVVVPDNLKAAVIKAGTFPEINRTYLELSKLYDTVIAPARVRMPQDKSKAEAGVLFVSRWITAPLRRRQFYSLEEVNDAIKELLPVLNERKFKRLPGTRHSRFLEMDKPALKPLPSKPFEFTTWVAEQKVPSDYHLVILKHTYSVPYQYVGKMVEACYSSSTVQFFHDSQRIATHRRSYEVEGRTLDKSHMTKAHQAYSERQLSDFLLWAKDIGVYAVTAIEAQFQGKPEYSYSAAINCDKLKRLSTLHGGARFEAACHRASLLKSLTVKTIRSILNRKVESLDLSETVPEDVIPSHHNLRGADYYSVGGVL